MWAFRNRCLPAGKPDCWIAECQYVEAEKLDRRGRVLEMHLAPKVSASYLHQDLQKVLRQRRPRPLLLHPTEFGHNLTSFAQSLLAQLFAHVGRLPTSLAAVAASVEGFPAGCLELL